MYLIYGIYVPTYTERNRSPSPRTEPWIQFQMPPVVSEDFLHSKLFRAKIKNKKKPGLFAIRAVSLLFTKPPLQCRNR